MGKKLFAVLLMMLVLAPVAGIAGNSEDLTPYLNYKYFPYTPHLGCQPGKPQSNAILVQAEEFWGVMCESTKAGTKRLPPAAQATAQLLLDSILQMPESEKLGADTQYLLGRFWLLNGSLAEAITTFMDAMLSDPNTPEYASALAVSFERFYNSTKDATERQEMGIPVANQMSQRLLSMTTPKVDDYLMVARIYYMSNVPVSAAAVLNSAMTSFSNSSTLALAAVLSALRVNDINSAAAYLQKTVGLPVEYDSTQKYLLGVTAWRLGKLDVATEALKQVIQKNRRQNDAQRLLKLIRSSVR